MPLVYFDKWEFDLPDGLTRRGNLLYATCLSCEQEYEWPGEIEDFDIDDPMNYCGGSPWCLP